MKQYTDLFRSDVAAIVEAARVGGREAAERVFIGVCQQRKLSKWEALVLGVNVRNGLVAAGIVLRRGK